MRRVTLSLPESLIEAIDEERAATFLVRSRSIYIQGVLAWHIAERQVRREHTARSRRPEEA